MCMSDEVMTEVNVDVRRSNDVEVNVDVWCSDDVEVNVDVRRSDDRSECGSQT